MEVERGYNPVMTRGEFIRSAVILASGLAAYAGFGSLLRPTLKPEKPVPQVSPSRKEILGFVPHWVIPGDISDDELNTLTTLAYFNFPLGGDGNPLVDNPGYKVLFSKEAEELFERARKSNTHLMLTTAVENSSGQMDNGEISALLNDKEAQKRAIQAVIRAQKEHSMDSINVDIEHSGEVGPELRNNFSSFVQELRERAGVRVTVSVYASSAIRMHMYDLGKLAVVSDGIVMMAYDFYNKGSEIVAPTAPLYGHKEGRYWYDVATAVEDFKALVPAEKIILGIPKYGYGYLVVEDKEMAPVRDPFRLTQDIWVDNEVLTMDNLTNRLNSSTSNRSGWDDVAKVGWRSYLDQYDIRRMVYMEDERSIAAKCDLVLRAGLGGIAFWATGYGHNTAVADVLRQKKFGPA